MLPAEAKTLESRARAADCANDVSTESASALTAAPVASRSATAIRGIEDRL
jgi:hypothetical protein